MSESDTAPVDPWLLEILVCPVTKGTLVYDRVAGELISASAGLAYPIRDGIPIMLPDEARKLGEYSGAAVEIRLVRAERLLKLVFADHAYALPAEFLRVESPSAEVQGHTPDQRKTVPGKRAVGISAIEPVGNYAIRLTFDDGHDTGIYSWAYLETLGREQATRWQGYLARLAAAGLGRDP